MAKAVLTEEEKRARSEREAANWSRLQGMGEQVRRADRAAEAEKRRADGLPPEERRAEGLSQ